MMQLIEAAEASEAADRELLLSMAARLGARP